MLNDIYLSVDNPSVPFNFILFQKKVQYWNILSPKEKC